MANVRAAWLSVAGVTLLVGAGCGDGDGDGGTSGVSGSKKLNEITDAEAKTLCEWVEKEGYEPSKEELCTVSGAYSSATQAECEAFVPQCLKEDIGDDDDDDDCSNASDDVPDTCAATVSELEACFKDVSAADRALVTGVSCADAGDIEIDIEPPASCKLVNEKCPGFLDVQDDGDDDGDDEANGGVAEFDDFSCANGDTIPDVFTCDGEDDCGDGSDEQNCG